MKYNIDDLEKLEELSDKVWREIVTRRLVVPGEGDATDMRTVRWWVWQAWVKIAPRPVPLPSSAWIRSKFPPRYCERRGGISYLVASCDVTQGFLSLKDDPRGPDGWADSRGLAVVDPRKLEEAVGIVAIRRQLLTEKGQET